MKKIFNLLVSFVFICSFSVTVKGKIIDENYIKQLPTNKSVCSGIIVTPKNIKINSKIININMSVPQISGLENNSVQESINKMFYDYALNMKDKMEKEANEYYKDSQKYNFEITPFELTQNYNVHYNKDGILSITTDFYYYAGGAHGMTDRIPYNIDLKSGDKITLDTLLGNNPDYLKTISSEVKRQMESNKEMFFPETIKNFSGVTKDDFFYIEDGAIVIYYPLYKVAPYAAGIPEFKIPFSLFKNGVNIKCN